VTSSGPKLCRICKADTYLKWRSNFDTTLNSEAFAITDTNYGKTSTIYQCQKCGFRQCTDLKDLLPFYENLQDPIYEQSRKERLLQAAMFLRHARKHVPQGKLLDVGAGSGILVEKALSMGYKAQGIEPSEWLQQQAEKKNLPIYCGLLDDIPKESTFDVITLIDVIEHVEDPRTLLDDCFERLRENGVILVATPDCGSFFANLLRRSCKRSNFSWVIKWKL